MFRQKQVSRTGTSNYISQFLSDCSIICLSWQGKHKSSSSLALCEKTPLVRRQVILWTNYGINLPTRPCVTRPQWINCTHASLYGTSRIWIIEWGRSQLDNGAKEMHKQPTKTFQHIFVAYRYLRSRWDVPGGKSIAHGRRSKAWGGLIMKSRVSRDSQNMVFGSYTINGVIFGPWIEWRYQQWLARQGYLQTQGFWRPSYWWTLSGIRSWIYNDFLAFRVIWLLLRALTYY